MNEKYPYHPDFKPLERAAKVTRLQTVKLNTFSLFLLGIAHRLAAATFRLPKGVRTRKFKIPREGSERIGAVLYEAQDASPDEPCLVYYHGGGFVNEANGGVKRNACLYAVKARCKVFFVNYRLAPKYGYPTLGEDCFAGYRYVCENAKTLGIDRARLAVGGDSAGAFFAALVCQMLRDRASGLPMPLFQMLLYPVTDKNSDCGTMRDYADAPTWNASLTRQVWKLYLKGKDGAYADLFSSGNLKDLPPAYFEFAEFDCLRSEGERYAEALEKAGIPVAQKTLAGTVHGFDWVFQSEITQNALEERVRFLRRYFHPTDS